jgi:putative ABC transport system permease protein
MFLRAILSQRMSSQKISQSQPSFFTSLSVGWFLATRDLARASRWTTLLIISVMTLTFLNLVVVSGILVGLIQGSVDANKRQYTSDIFITEPLSKVYIEDSRLLASTARSTPGVIGVTERYLSSAKIEANYKRQVQADETRDTANASAAGISPEDENGVTGLSSEIVEGEYLEPGETGSILMGADLLYKYNQITSPDVQVLDAVEVGDTVRVTIGETVNEFVVKGILDSKLSEIDLRIFMNESELRQLINRRAANADEIAIMVEPGVDIVPLLDTLRTLAGPEGALVRTAEEAQPKFLQDITATFAILGNAIGSIGLAVASITIFIVIFVNAITRRRFIGILKGIGITSTAIQWSYMFQSLFYAGAGIAIGMALVFGVLKPFFVQHPIDFPFSDGILVATMGGTLLRAGLLLIATVIAGYLPAKIVVRQNTLDAILGR